MMNENNVENYLFDSIKYESEESFEQFANNITVEQSIYLISTAIQMSHKHGIFSLHESEVLSKSLRVLNKNIFNKK